MSKIYAAGAVVVDRTASKPRLAMIHRPRYDDWSLPKGKLDRGELAPVAAVREVREETGLQVRLGAPLGRISYPIGKDKKLVDFWCADVVESGLATDDEADQLEWLTFKKAVGRATEKDYRDLIEVAQHARPTTPLIIVRHGKATERKHWRGDDVERPLNARGRRQSDELVDLFAAYGVRRVVTSPATRCVETVRPYVDAYGAEATLPDVLTEERGCRDGRAVTRLLRELATDVGKRGVPTVVCGHRPLLPAMLRGMGVAPMSFATGDCLVLHICPRGKVRTDEFHANPR